MKKVIIVPYTYSHVDELVRFLHKKCKGHNSLVVTRKDLKS